MKTLVLEKHDDFLRDFRGDTVHPSTLQLFDELGLLRGLLERPHDAVATLSARAGGRQFQVADFRRLPVGARFIALMPQWDFLDFLADEARKLPAFSLRMGCEATGLVEQDGPLVTNLRRLLQKLSAHHVRLDKADALNVLARCAGQGWDGVFLDPPFLDGQNDDLTRRALSAAKAAIAPTGWVYLESPREWLAADLLALGLVPHKQGQAGQVHYALLHVAQLA